MKKTLTVLLGLADVVSDCLRNRTGVTLVLVQTGIIYSSLRLVQKIVRAASNRQEFL